MKKSKQSDNMELHSFPTRHTNCPDIEEYHEISDNVDEQISTVNKVFNKSIIKSPNDYDFFTKYFTKNDSKKCDKGKRLQKEKSNLMDVINAEIESSTVPITDTIITRIDHNVELQKSYLLKIPKNILLCGIPLKCFRSDKSKTTTTLSPIFPKILDNAIQRGEEIQVEYMEPILFEDLVAKNANSVKDYKTKFLDIEIRNIKFQHHHEYSLEKLLADSLIEYFSQYEQVTKSLNEISREIRINRETNENLKKDLLKINRKDDLRFDQTVRQYTGKLLHSKEKQKKILKAEKDIKHKIISLWSDIEMLREKTKVTLTPYTVEITTTVLENTKYEQEWNHQFDLEFADMLYKLEFEHVNKYLEYKDAKNEQKLQGVEKKKLVKPKLQIDNNAIRVDVENIVNNLIKKEILQVAIKKNDNILTQKQGTNKLLGFHFEIYVDDIFVCESEHYSNSKANLNVIFAESFSVQIVSNNQKLTIVLFENEERVSCVDIKLIDIKDSFINSKLTTVNFVYDRVQKANSKTVGCGNDIKEIAGANKVRLKSSNIFKNTFYTKCDVQFKIGWQQTAETQSETLKSSFEIGDKIKRIMNGTEKPNVDMLKDIIGKIYDRDVSNDENLTNTLNRIINSRIRNDDDFALDENSPEFVRFKLLHLRNIGGFNNIDNKTIPLHSSQITTEQLNYLQREKERNFDLNYLSDKQIEMDRIEIQRFVGAKYVQKINKNILRHLNEHLMRKSHKDVIRDFSDLGLRSFFSKPSIQAAGLSSDSKNQLLESLRKEQEIQINAMRAFNLLDRSLADDEDCEKIAGKDGFKVRTLRPFVRVGYHGVSSQTCSAIGCHPTWNHTLRINSKLEPLSSLHINIYDESKEIINDTYSDDDDDGQRSRTVHYRYYNKWLGTVQIPLYTVLSLGSLKGIFKITTPPSIFGYETIQSKESNSLLPVINQLMKKEVSYLALSITTTLSKLGGLYNYNLPLEDDYLIKHLNNYINKYTYDFPNRNLVLSYIDSSGKNKCVTQFLQPILLPSREFFPKNPKSSESALSKLSGFSTSSSTKSSGTRRVADLDKDNPCQDWRDGSTSEVINACLRYVALIPTYDVTDTHVVTLIGVELLKVLHGSPIDHTILLASYFLQIGIKCWIASGLGLPRGLTTYVLIQYDLTLHRFVQTTDQLFKSKGFLNQNNGYLWYVYDAVSGERYELRDVGCPLKTVHFVFDEENIWVNIQSSQDIESVSFDLSRSSDWEPVFDNSILVMRNPAVLDSSSLYTTPPNVEALRLLIESKIKAKVQKWRSHMKTIWNRYCGGVLRDTLTHWEYWAFNQSVPKPGPSHKLKQLMVTYKIFGFPLNMPFVNTKSVISTVKSTSLHVNDDPNIEFALAVEVFSYPNNVLSVWVFFASISRI